MKNPVAIIVGGTGQFGVYTSKLLLEKGYKVIVTSRNIKKKKLFKISDKKLIYVNLDINKKYQIKRLIKKNKPSEIYYFAGQSSVVKSFYSKKETLISNFKGCKNFLDVILNTKAQCKFLNASSCEIFGKKNNKISINDKKFPKNPYGKSKLKSFNITKEYREKYKLKTYNAIIFNTESVLRSKEFLIPKICIAAINAKRFNTVTEFGNLKISREWNWCPEQVQYLFKFLKKDPQDFLLTNGKKYSAKMMLKFAFNYFNLDYRNYTKKNKIFFRKNDVNSVNSNYKESLKKNNLSRKSKIFGKSIIFKIIKHYLNNDQYKL